MPMCEELASGDIQRSIRPTTVLGIANAPEASSRLNCYDSYRVNRTALSGAARSDSPIIC